MFLSWRTFSVASVIPVMTLLAASDSTTREPADLYSPPLVQAPRPAGVEGQRQIVRATRSALFRVNYSRLMSTIEGLQQTLRNIKSLRQLIQTGREPAKRQFYARSLEDEIAVGIEQTADLLSQLREGGFETIIYENREALAQGFSRDTLPPFERELLLNSSFSPAEVDQFISFFATSGHEVLSRLQAEGGIPALVQDLRNKSNANKGSNASKVGSYIKIIGGAIAIGGNLVGGALIVVAFPAAAYPTALIGVPASAGAGLYYIGVGVSELSSPAR